MTDEIRLAFSHPSERAEATAPDEPRDRISLRDYVVEVEIGAFETERGATQRVRFNVVVELRPQGGPVDDDVDRILSYDTITEAISAELAAERLNLLETLAERVADRILQAPLALRVFVRVEKLDRGPGALGVEIVRSRLQAPVRDLDVDATAAPRPYVVHLSDAAIGSDALAGWIDALERAERPVILCAGEPARDVPRTPLPEAQRRIDLLAIEQNAWNLAGRDPRCIVAGTRTELDWGMKNGQISVWAPSKMVLDLADGAAPPGHSAKELAAWLAGLVDAAELVCVDDGPPVPAPVPVRRVSPDAASLF